VWVVSRTLLKGRARPMGNHASLRRAYSPDLGGSVRAAGANARSELGILTNRERELGLDRRETG
jgi:hypothetical protein